MSILETAADRPTGGFSLARASEAVFVILMAVCAAGAFVAMDAGGLWTDELYTVYFADETMPDLGTALARTMEDVHPPLYYLLAWAVANALGADVADVIRPMSAVLCILALAALHVALPRSVSRNARLFACALAATSFAFHLYAQEGRSYALMFMVVLAQAGMALRLLDALRDPDASMPLGLLAAFAALGMIAGLTHYYAVPLTGGLVGGLILLSRRWGGAALVGLAGLAVLAVIAAYVALHSERMLVDKQATWFSASFDFIWMMTVRGMRNVMGGWLNALTMLTLGGVLLIALRRAAVETARGEGEAPRWSQAALLAFACAFTVLSSIAITLLYAPSYSERVWVMFVPLVWMLGGLAWQTVGERLPEGEETPLKAAVVVLMALSAGSVALRPAPDKETWLDSGLFVAGHAACSGASIPVVIRDDVIISGDTASVFYGEQLPRSFDVRLRPIHLSSFDASFAGGDVADTAARRIDGTDPCPVLVWTADQGRPDIERLEARLRTELSGTGRTVTIRKFFHAPADPTGLFVPHLGSGLAYVLVAEDTPGR